MLKKDYLHKVSSFLQIAHGKAKGSNEIVANIQKAVCGLKTILIGASSWVYDSLSHPELWDLPKSLDKELLNHTVQYDNGIVFTQSEKEWAMEQLIALAEKFPKVRNILYSSVNDTE